ncbi:hypothetical protein BJ508DRAFT_376126 [Ascobolus immersus RN42]|uniref:Elongator complex protein 5 n=1 Tax=Ascobolus immersus RN42 TaxID=1160509 RepID=A0A3N4IBG2_ASCIM|nr:hypothetical protein BJ508DRAFT_376126 [Ascobolus immersus RN42]
MADSLATLEAKMRAQRKNKPITLMSRLLTPPSSAKEPPSSPFILILDSLSMTGRHMRDEIINRFAYTAKNPINIIFVAWESPKFRIPEAVSTIIKPGTRPFEETQQDILKAIKPNQQNLVVIDSLHPLTLPNLPPDYLVPFLSSLLGPTTTLLCTYHLSFPPFDRLPQYKEYPTPLRLLKFLSTAILTIRSSTQALINKQRVDRCLAPWRFGWWDVDFGEEDCDEGDEVDEHGIPWPRYRNSSGKPEFIVEFEIRRKSGRGMLGKVLMKKQSEESEKWEIEDVESIPGWVPDVASKGPAEQEEDDWSGLTSFSLGLTEEQKKKRDELELPYYDAQKGLSGDKGGGRILYVPEDVDDWDDEEDEI